MAQPMPAQRILAIDPGERRTGVAATDWTGTIAVPLARLDHRGMDEIPELLVALVSERETERLLIGVPLGVDGSHGPQAKKVLALVDKLTKRFPQLEICTIDEAHSSDVAHAQLKAAGVKAARRKHHVDSLAALEILRRHLDLA
ncbi:MAG: Holliday junction resolvase RuvX [Planctomycetes bacterium]|nr:Holliday junction resolvase RuvX [Planctomycetota bacterium]MCB9891118.1 Holliday junction resolvase RuvX [Planctomycetota bacterium]